MRAEAFLSENPQAVWVQTVAECLTRLVETWDEVHLDHDLGGKTFVDMNEDDCGMEVIRWLCKEPRDHLRQTLFFVHTHNSVAGLLMVLADAIERLQSRVPPVRVRPGPLARPRRGRADRDARNADARTAPARYRPSSLGDAASLDRPAERLLAVVEAVPHERGRPGECRRSTSRTDSSQATVGKRHRSDSIVNGPRGLYGKRSAERLVGQIDFRFPSQRQEGSP